MEILTKLLSIKDINQYHVHVCVINKEIVYKTKKLFIKQKQSVEKWAILLMPTKKIIQLYIFSSGYT